MLLLAPFIMLLGATPPVIADSPRPFSKAMVSIDFDDGWLSACQNGTLILERYHLRSNQYIISGFLGKKNYVSLTDILAMQARGHEINAHSETHTSFEFLKEYQILEEIVGCKLDLEKQGVRSIKVYGFPFGDWNPVSVHVVSSNHYIGARTALPRDGGINYRNGDPFLLKTISAESKTVEELKKWINRTIDQKGWLILVFHQVKEDPHDPKDIYWTSPKDLEEICRYLDENQSKISVVTASEGISKMKR